MEDFDRSFEERISLFKNEIMKLAVEYNIFPLDNVYNQFSYRYKDGKIWYEITEPTDEGLIMEAVKLYRHYFPEGQGHWPKL